MGELDLPLSSCISPHQVTNYSLHLELEPGSKRFRGQVLFLFIFLLFVLLLQVVLHLVTEQEWQEQQFELVLDCNDIDVERVEEVEEGQQKTLRPLAYTLGPWSLTVTAQGPTPRLVRVVYSTLPCSRSLLWRSDPAGGGRQEVRWHTSSGHPCVHTAAAGINNRGLLPCQDLPRRVLLI